MPLRKKHVRRLVFALLVGGVLGPTIGLVVYGLHLSGGAYGRDLQTALASRLRCDATVTRARPTGPTTAAADAVRLAWTTADGQLALDLEDLSAQRNAYGWYLTAQRGRIALAGADPYATLAAINQRLVQVEHPSGLLALVVKHLRLDLALDPLAVTAEVRALATARMAAFEVTFHDAAAWDAAGTVPPPPLAVVRLAPTSERGVFGGLHLERTAVPLAALRRLIRTDDAKGGAEVRGTADLTVDWYWPDADAETATVSVAARDVDLAPWTRGVPGGPVTGTADLTVRYARPRQGPVAMALHLASPGGTIAGETIDWLDGLTPGLAGPGKARPQTVAFGRTDVRFNLVGGRGWFEGQADGRGAIPLLTVRLLGVDVPLMWAPARPFPAQGLWGPLGEALGIGG
ncbi:MAG TPA: hypothetical protein VM431_03545 [Phycisphaerae bacterium]|nr:hypothetical protein [Phycisphaerae bacterium]